VLPEKYRRDTLRANRVIVHTPAYPFSVPDPAAMSRMRVPAGTGLANELLTLK